MLYIPNEGVGAEILPVGPGNAVMGGARDQGKAPESGLSCQLTIPILLSSIGLWSEIDKWLTKNTPKKRLAKPLSTLNPKAGVSRRQVVAAMPGAGCIALIRTVIAVAVNLEALNKSIQDLSERAS